MAEQFRGEGKRAEALETSHAFHSELLEPALDAFEAFAEKIPFENLTRTLVCNRTGKALGAQTRLDAQYWRRHSRQPVQFAQSVQTLASLGCRVVLEIGPQPVLAAMALRAWPDATPAPQPVASLRRDSSDARQIEEALGQLYVAGARIDFKAVEAPWKRKKVDLPLYPFQRKRFWFKQTRAPAQDKKSANSQILQMIEDGQLEELGGRLRLSDDKGATQRVLQALYDHYQRERFSQNTAENLYELAWSKRAGRDFCALDERAFLARRRLQRSVGASTHGRADERRPRRALRRSRRRRGFPASRRRRSADARRHSHRYRCARGLRRSVAEALRANGDGRRLRPLAGSRGLGRQDARLPRHERRAAGRRE